MNERETRVTVVTKGYTTDKRGRTCIGPVTDVLVRLVDGTYRVCDVSLMALDVETDRFSINEIGENYDVIVNAFEVYYDKLYGNASIRDSHVREAVKALPLRGSW